MSVSEPSNSALPITSKLKALLVDKIDMSRISWDDMATAIGPNADKYDKLWHRMQGSSRNVFNSYSLCWSAIPFFGVAWAVARKMDMWAAIMAVGMVITAVLIPSDAAALGLALVLSFSQKSIYLRWLMAHIQLINDQGLVGEQRQQALVAAGGLDAKSGWITVAVVVGINVLLWMAFGHD